VRDLNLTGRKIEDNPPRVSPSDIRVQHRNLESAQLLDRDLDISAR
jgi:hypothetical protein